MVNTLDFDGCLSSLKKSSFAQSSTKKPSLCSIMLNKVRDSFKFWQLETNLKSILSWVIYYL
ncbi:hypothetical protein BpHYR1_005160 [Brachionus plicatilis]|uniref:Uncharacterized protein n=1 Tax=Brachionus plicatilis TaxID=10195 RepID=A0A3M7R0X0_BRAPC|nr:hypothetical protein BpHYR1_005160 [Brachionus plicatilis]